MNNVSHLSYATQDTLICFESTVHECIYADLNQNRFLTVASFEN